MLRVLMGNRDLQAFQVNILLVQRMTTLQRLHSFPGSPGVKGDIGAVGPTGSPGLQGPRGESGNFNKRLEVKNLHNS